MNLLNQFKDAKLCKQVLAELTAELKAPFRFMEVCGTHTVAIFQSGLRSLFPENLIHVSGPGCPVCVTHEKEVALFFELAKKDVILATFGDLMRVPGPDKKSLKDLQAEGAKIKVVYSPFDALTLARENPLAKVVFIGVGFETTAPTIAATLKIAKKEKVKNFFVLCLHKLVPPALRALVVDPQLKVEGFLLPGHVSAIIGVKPYIFLAKEYSIPAVIGGFEPLDILQALYLLVKMKNEGKAEIINSYKRVVKTEGNVKAQEVLAEVFQPCAALWRGIGEIPESGLQLREKYADFDAFQVFDLQFPEVPPLKGCKCGEVLKGLIRPDECPLFKKVCTPQHPVGPCMVSTEGSCAAYYKYSL